MTKIFTFGSCVSRDIFNHTPEEAFEVTLNIQRMSFALLPSSGYPITFEEIDLDYLDDFPWEVKMMVTEISKSAFNMVKSADADYVVMDLIEERFDFSEFTIDGFSYRCVRSGHFENFYEKYLKDKATDYRELSIDEYSDDEIRKYFNLSISAVLDKFTIDKIILIETYYAKEMIDEDGNIVPYENQEEIKKANKRLKRVYQIMKEVLDSYGDDNMNYNLIEADENTYGYKNHKWGAFPVHYTDEYYEEMGRAIKLITG